MKRVPKAKVALPAAILAVLGFCDYLMARREISLSAGSIHMSYRALALVTLTVLALCAIVARGLRRRRNAGAGDFFRPLTLPQKDGLGELAREINRKLAEESEAKLAALEQLRHAERLATVEHLAAGIAHQLGTPLSVVSGRAELIVDNDLSRGDIVHNARIILEQADRMTAIIRQLLDFSRHRGGQRTDVDLRQVVTSTLDLVSGVAAKAHVEILCETGDEPVAVYVHQNQIQQALLNIIMNGIQAMPSGGRLRVKVGSRHVQPPLRVSGVAGEYQCVTIEDEGVGISADHLPQLFEPFFTTKQVGEGTGLGLPVAYGIVDEHGGWIAVDSVAGRGSCFSILLPPASAAHGRREVA